jgi:hypothetical protein
MTHTNPCLPRRYSLLMSRASVAVSHPGQYYRLAIIHHDPDRRPRMIRDTKSQTVVSSYAPIHMGTTLASAGVVLRLELTRRVAELNGECMGRGKVTC